MAESEVARLLKRFEEEYRAGQNGLTGLAVGTARHRFITARMENMAQCHADLARIVGEDQAMELLSQHLNQSEMNGCVPLCHSGERTQ